MKRRGAAVVELENRGGGVFEVAQLGMSDAALKRDRLRQLAAAGEAHQVHHVDRDERNGSTVSRAIAHPLGALAQLIGFLRGDLRNFADIARSTICFRAR